MTALARTTKLCMGIGVLLSGCATAAPTPTAAPAPSPTPAIQNVMTVSTLRPGTYFIDPDGDSSTSLRVVYDVGGEGWEGWIGAVKFSPAGHAGLSITTVTNLVTDGCTNHMWADPPIGPGVEDLAAGLAQLSPFVVTSPPEDVTIYGYSGKHMAWTVPELPVNGVGEHGHFTDCVNGDLESWVAFIDTPPDDAFYGYTGPGYTEEFWILDVEGARLMITASTSAGSPSQDVAERDAILDSIRIEP